MLSPILLAWQRRAHALLPSDRHMYAYMRPKAVRLNLLQVNRKLPRVRLLTGSFYKGLTMCMYYIVDGQLFATLRDTKRNQVTKWLGYSIIRTKPQTDIDSKLKIGAHIHHTLCGPKPTRTSTKKSYTGKQRHFNEASR